MEKFGIGQSVKRKEDTNLLKGQGRYIGDINIDGQAYAYILRSPHANAKILSINSNDAKSIPGVINIFTGKDLLDIDPLPCVVDSMFEFKKSDGSKRFFPTHHVVAREYVRHVGDPVAVVVANSKSIAQDASEAIFVEYEVLDCSIDTMTATEKDKPIIYKNEGALDNQAFFFSQGNKQEIDKIFNKAAKIVSFNHLNQRIICNSMEPRGCIGEYNKEDNRYILYTNTQSVYRNRQVCAKQLGINENQLQVICPDVGGSFGMKGMPYPEQPLVLWLSKKLERPIKWYSDRSEAFISDTQGRDLYTKADLALNEEGSFLGLRVSSIGNMGAYASNFGPMILALGSTKLLPGCYTIPSVYAEVEVVITNKVFTDAYRGAGRPEASYVIERLVDLAAKELSIDQISMRKMNLIKESQMPFAGPTGLIYDSGDFSRNLNDCLSNSEITNFNERKKLSRENGKLRGMGISVYIEATAGGTPETSRIQISPEGKINVFTGSLAQGQAHATTFAQIVSEKLGVNYDNINILQGDSDALRSGGGTGGSRSVYSGGGAILATIEKVVDKAQSIAANFFEAAESDVEFSEGKFSVVGTDRSISIFDIAKLAQDKSYLPENTETELDETDSYTPASSTFPNGCHVVEIEVDPETGFAQIDRYYVVDDFGVVLNPMIVEGQVHGGIAQGIGQALYENAFYDKQGQLVTGSFMDYCMPRADNVPFIDLSMNEIKCTTNTLGAKGAGEAGTTGATGAVINALIDALSPFGINHIEMPATSEKVWKAINQSKKIAY